MASPCTETIAVRMTGREYALICGLANVRGMSASDVVRELLGFEREDDLIRSTSSQPRLVVVPGRACPPRRPMPTMRAQGVPAAPLR
jgi:hypothetical protein